MKTIVIFAIEASLMSIHDMSLVRRKPAFCICEIRSVRKTQIGNREADQRLCFRYTDGTICLLSKSEISSL